MKTNVLFALFLFLLPVSIQAQISGAVFRDFNGDGVKQSAEPLMADILVKAYNTAGSQCGTATTTSTSSPNYTVTGCSGNVRIEFTIPTTNTFPNGPLAGIDYSSFNGTDNGSSVQFVTSTQTGVDFAIFYPSGFSNQSVSNIKLAVPTYNSGDITDAGSNAYSDKAMITFPYLASGREDQANQTGTDNYTTATAGEIGSTWGLAYQKDQKRLFASTVLKRHVGLTSNGVGVIWKIDMNDPTNAGTPAIFYDFGAAAGTMGTNASRDIPVDKTKNSVDLEAWSKAGKVGFGDIEISDDNLTLYVVNLFDKKVYKLNASGSTASSATALPNFPNPGCTNGVDRPWALKFWRGKLYLGVICDGSAGGTRANLSAFVYEFNPLTNAWNTTPRITFPLDYDKGSIIGTGAALHWNPWTDNLSDFEGKGGGFYFGLYQPQPVLSDIEFDEEGSMHLAFLDRAGFQVGHRNALPTATPANKEVEANNGNGISSGDILRTYLNPTTGLYELEEDGKAGPYTSAGTGTGITGYGGVNSLQGPSKLNPGEFYWDDQVSNGFHSEISVGGLVYVPGQKEIVLSVFDPITLDAGGIESFGITDGSSTRRYQIYYGAAVDEGGPGKANGMGDIEILGDVSPIEIGNRVWLDTDSDGIQDAGEVGISGVQVQLLKGATVISTSTTDANGNYYFSSATGTSTTSIKYGITQLVPNMAYTVHFPTTTTVSGTSYNLTTANSTTGGGTDLIDSDAAASGDVSVLTTDIPVAGANNHTFDVGYTAVSGCIGNLIANPSFETGDFTSWSRYNPNTEDRVLTDAFINKDGTYYAVVSPDGNIDPLNYLYQDIPISAGSTLNLSVYGAVHDPSVDHQFKLIFLNASSTEISQQNVQVSHDIDSDNTLELYTLSGVAPAGTVKVRVEGYINGVFTGNGGIGLKSDGWCLQETPAVCTQPTFTINAVQPTCASPTGSISIGTITGPDSYTFNYDDMGTYVSGVLGVNGTASNGASVASGLSAGTYTVQLFKSTDNTCISNPNQTITLVAATGCGGGGQPDLELTKTADKTTVVSGNTISYTITLKNVGTADATGVKVKDLIPSGLTYVSSAPSQGTYTSSTGIWDVGTVAQGSTLTLTITVTVN